MTDYPADLRAISIINPFGWEICMGFKPYEFRSWESSFRGLCLIHVSASKECEGYFDEYLEHEEITTEEIKQMRKSIIGFATVTKMIWDEQDQQWAHKVEHPEIFDEFIPCPGALNYWSPYKNKPEQSVAFQKAWDMIEAKAYCEANPEEYKNSLAIFGLEDLEINGSGRVLITPAPQA
ncbi:hypothetical protein H6F75_26320 [Nodosilinea sp. FACHB-131]|uniref:hypothetical protein n=1 Tax=Cyanophyceae TaxID=3028117 RepID=UPI0016855CED|nr:hypothetical protein [Nodosilinea sp. FACHB-131]MBD1877005.1 hypothetical protein [Nodosilinea sp. FACHB-131]